MTEKTLTTGSWGSGPIEFLHLELGRETGLSPRVVGVTVTPGQCQHRGRGKARVWKTPVWQAMLGAESISEAQKASQALPEASGP